MITWAQLIHKKLIRWYFLLFLLCCSKS